jgi:hypothetical protein
MSPSLLPFTVTALHADKPPIRIGLLAFSRSQALMTAQEIFPDRILGAIELEPQWQDDPA